jgi:predicted nucleic acid-binding protein
MRTTIVDTSVIVKWLSSDNENYLEQADLLIQDVQNAKVELYAPELAKYEVGNVLFFSKKLTPDQAAILLKRLANLPIKFIPEFPDQAEETYNLAFNLGITYYDATFLSLAKIYNAVLITDNTKHQGKATNIPVFAIKDYPITHKYPRPESN